MTTMTHSNKKIKTEHFLETPLDEDNIFGDDDMFGDDIPIEELEDLTPPIEPDDSFGEDIPVEEIQVLETKPKASRKKFIRYFATSISKGKYIINEEEYSEVVISLIQEGEKRITVARLREEWLDTSIQTGDIVHIPFISYTPEIIIDNKQHFLIVHPDRLISCTAVADSYVCTRKSVLQLKVRPISEYTEALVHGNIIHSVLQRALETQDFKVSSIEQGIEQTVMSRLPDLYAIDQDEQTALQMLNVYAPTISRFGSTFVSKKPRPSGIVNTDMGIDPKGIMGFETMSISNVLDIEEHVWSPTFGLKGMMDASVEMTMSKNNRVITVPFELKTGKNSRYITNRAQTLLYTLLMADRYDVEVEAGLLYYSKSNSIYVVPSSRNDLRSLIMARNALASAFNKRDHIPAVIRDSHTCQYCYVNTTCTIYHKALENGTRSSSGLYDLFDEQTGHMTKEICKFFEKWWNLLDSEDVDLDYVRKNIWSQSAHIREMMGKCLSDLKVNLPFCEVEPTKSRWKYSFVRNSKDRPLFCSISIGDPIVISSMKGHINLAMGFVTSISTEEITVDLTEPLRTPPMKGNGFHSMGNQTFKSFIQSAFNTSEFYLNPDHLYRIDRDEMSIGMNMLRYNLVQLIEKDQVGSTKRARLRELIIGLGKPNFNSDPLDLSSSSLVKMNPDQKNALKRVIQAEDYTLILGMPGTGKTTTTAEIIKYLVSKGKSVLITAYTHTALDNVLSKVHENGIDVLRLGNSSKVMPSLRDCIPSNNTNIKTVKEMQDFYHSKRVVGVTCLGIGDILLQKREFDYCIIDEASQITLPTCIGPLRYAKRFVLVGDLYQLPPIVKNKKAGENGLNKSLFSMLAEAQPDSICYLEYQYRMTKDIMDLANHLVYDGKLKCGTYPISIKKLELPELEEGMKCLHENKVQPCKGENDCWLKIMAQPERKVIFMNTDELNGRDSRPFEGIQNDTEVTLVEQTVETLIECGISEEQMAVISVYRSQLRALSQKLKSRQGIEMATIDKYQGRDKDCVIISLVRNNDTGNVGDLLRDWRRLNVAITRAKSKLIIFGSASTLKSTALYSNLLDYLEKRGWILCLKQDSERTHTFDKENIIIEQEKPKKVSNIKALLKNKEILKDIYNNTF